MKTIFIFLVFVQIVQAAQLTPAEAMRRLQAAQLTPSQSISLLRKNATAATSQTKSAVSATLKSIIIPEVSLEGYTMTEVIDFLDSKIKEHHPNINLIVIQSVPNTAPNVVAPPPVQQFDPITGLPIQGVIAPNINDAVKVFNPDDITIVGLKGKLRNLNVLQIIELATISFDAPVQFSVTNYGVMFFPLPEDQAGLVSRMFSVKGNIFGTPPTLGGSKMNKTPINNTPGMGRSILNISK